MIDIANNGASQMKLDDRIDAGLVAVDAEDTSRDDGNAISDNVAIAPSRWMALVALARKHESEHCDFPSDLSINHDHYLHGQSKR